MEFSAFFIFAVCTTSMTCLTFGKERERAMLFPDYYFFAKRRLENYTIETRKVKNLDDCELMCYLNDNCVSLNFKKDPDNNEAVHICELNNATHLKNDSDLTSDANFYYRGSKNACDKNSHCENNATCQSGFTAKGYQCLCPSGFEGKRCETDTDECETIPRKCHEEAACNNTRGSFVCTCKPGFIGDGQNCTDVDECKGNHSCHENANCTNTFGSHVCDCQAGYTGDGQNCTDIDECKGNHSCHVNASCKNTIGSHECECHPGFAGNGRNCAADPCVNYNKLSGSNRKRSYKTPLSGPVLCDDTLPEGWYRFVGAAGTKMATKSVNRYHCGTAFPGWLDDAHPRLEEGKASRKVSFSDGKYIFIDVKNCGSFYIYNILKPPGCERRYCGSD